MNKDTIKEKLSVLREIRPSTIILTAAMIVLAVLGIIDYREYINLGNFQGVMALLAVTDIVFIASTMILRKRESRTFKFMRKIAVVAAVLELTLFQLPSYSMLPGDYTEHELFPADASITGGYYNINTEDKSIKIYDSQEVVLDFPELNMTVGTIMADIEFAEETKRVNLWVDMADETHIDPRVNVASNVIVNGAEDSEYMACQFSGEVSQLKLKFSCANDYESAVIKRIYLNRIIPFDISAVRFGFLTFAVTFCYAVAVSGFLKKPFRQTRKFTTGSILALTAAAVVIATSIIMTKLPDEGFKSRWKLETGDQITQEIVDAFEAGQVNLIAEPTPELLDIENPYDWGQRNSSGAYYLWDHVFYEEKYYSYYGIAPVLTFFLPYHKLTDYYFATDMAIWIFSCIGLVFIGLTYLAVVRRWFRNVPSGCILAAFVIMLATCGIWYNVGRTIFYEISISSGFMYLSAGAFFLISSNVLSIRKTSFVKTALASLFTGLAVLSRPTLAVYAICAAVFWIMGIKKSSKKLTGRIVYSLCAVLPIGLLGILQMWYNYARFGSPFDFGIQYSLTINDFVNNQFHLLFVIIGVFNYLFAMPSITPDYPYIKTPFSKFGVDGYYFSDIGNTSGIIFLAMPVVGYLFAGKALRYMPDRKTKLCHALMVGLPCVVMPLVILFSIWESGYAVRYTADFSWQIIIGAFAILFYLYRKSKNETKKNILRAFIGISAAASIIINAVHIIPFAFEEPDYPEICRALQDTIAFWN